MGLDVWQLVQQIRQVERLTYWIEQECHGLLERSFSFVSLSIGLDFTLAFIYYDPDLILSPNVTQT